jgi:hypothetical protein
MLAEIILVVTTYVVETLSFLPNMFTLEIGNSIKSRYDLK